MIQMFVVHAMVMDVRKKKLKDGHEATKSRWVNWFSIYVLAISIWQVDAMWWHWTLFTHCFKDISVLSFSKAMFLGGKCFFTFRPEPYHLRANDTWVHTWTHKKSCLHLFHLHFHKTLVSVRWLIARGIGVWCLKSWLVQTINIHPPRASPTVLTMWLQTVKFIARKSKCAGFSSGNWFFCTKFVQLAVAGKRRNTVMHLQKRV